MTCEAKYNELKDRMDRMDIEMLRQTYTINGMNAIISLQTLGIARTMKLLGENVLADTIAEGSTAEKTLHETIADLKELEDSEKRKKELKVLEKQLEESKRRRRRHFKINSPDIPPPPPPSSPTDSDPGSPPPTFDIWITSARKEGEKEKTPFEKERLNKEKDK
jgi:hypothetical protein